MRPQQWQYPLGIFHFALSTYVEPPLCLILGKMSSNQIRVEYVVSIHIDDRTAALSDNRTSDTSCCYCMFLVCLFDLRMNETLSFDYQTPIQYWKCFLIVMKAILWEPTFNCTLVKSCWSFEEHHKRTIVNYDTQSYMQAKLRSSVVGVIVLFCNEHTSSQRSHATHCLAVVELVTLPLLHDLLHAKWVWHKTAWVRPLNKHAHVPFPSGSIC